MGSLQNQNKWGFAIGYFFLVFRLQSFLLQNAADSQVALAITWHVHITQKCKEVFIDLECVLKPLYIIAKVYLFMKVSCVLWRSDSFAFVNFFFFPNLFEAYCTIDPQKTCQSVTVLWLFVCTPILGSFMSYCIRNTNEC